MPLITDSEMEDFDAAILQAGFEVDDISVVDLEDEPRAIGVAVWAGTVTVTYKPTGISRTYEVSTWSANFEDDLKSNVFQTREPSLH